MDFLKKYSYAIYLGAILNIVNANVTTWEFYVILIPTIFLVTWKISEQKGGSDESTNSNADSKTQW